MKRTPLLLLPCLFLMVSQPTGAQWMANGIPVSGEFGQRPDAASDGAGGVIVTWSANGDIYAQRIDAAGNEMWTSGGLPICVADSTQSNPVIVADGLGGAVIAWEDGRGSGVSSDIYAQHVDALGNFPIAAPADGVPICTAAGHQSELAIAATVAGGAIIAWEDNRFTVFNDQIYASLMTASGSVLWTPNGVLVSSSNTDEGADEFALMEDGSGGVIIAWNQRRDPGTFFYTAMVSRLDASGVTVPGWGGPGGRVLSTGEVFGRPAITTDGAGGAIIAFSVADSVGIYVQKVSFIGTPLCGG